MIFSKTFRSEMYSQIVAMLDTEAGYAEGMAPVPVIKLYFWLDGATHEITIAYNNDELGHGLRAQTFENMTQDWADKLIFENANRGKI